ncbi:MAG TPA: Clp protease N-terminal domain-containing protein, partial [Paludibacter sp.]
MTVNYSEQLHNVLLYSSQEAERLGNNYVGPEHLLLGILRNGSGKAIDILNGTHVSLSKVKQTIESQIRTDLEPSGQEIPTLKSTEKIKKIMELETRSMSAETADTEHLLLAILKEKNNLAGDILSAEHLTYDQAKAFIEKPEIIMGSSFSDEDDDEEDPRQKKKPSSAAGAKQSDTPALDTFGTDITKAALENRLDPIVGRNKEIERLAQILSRRKK